MNNITERIKDFNKGRDSVALQIKYKAMAENPFRFFRGTCGLFYEELSKQYPFPSSPAVWACGDLHIENFGSYKGSTRLVYFDLNDFDEALLAPALWEICRLTASVQVAADEIGFSVKEKEQLINTLLYYYKHVLKKGKPVVLEREVAKGLVKRLINKVEDRKDAELLKKRTDGEHPDKLLLSAKLFPLSKPEKRALIASFNRWLKSGQHKKLQAIDAGFRIAGTGSIGVKRYIILLEHTDNTEKKLLVDVKQALPSAVGNYINIAQPVWSGDAARIISAQEMMQHVSPAFLSSFQFDDKWFVVKELQPTTDKVNIALAIKQPGQVEDYIANLGILTASAQLRSSGRKGSATADALHAFAEDDSWVKMLKDWSVKYEEQVKREYAEYKDAYDKGFFKN